MVFTVHGIVQPSCCMYFLGLRPKKYMYIHPSHGTYPIHCKNHETTITCIYMSSVIRCLPDSSSQSVCVWRVNNYVCLYTVVIWCNVLGSVVPGENPLPRSGSLCSYQVSGERRETGETSQCCLLPGNVRYVYTCRIHEVEQQPAYNIIRASFRGAGERFDPPNHKQS